jgi:hypothetical protein
MKKKYSVVLGDGSEDSDMIEVGESGPDESIESFFVSGKPGDRTEGELFRLVSTTKDVIDALPDDMTGSDIVTVILNTLYCFNITDGSMLDFAISLIEHASGCGIVAEEGAAMICDGKNKFSLVSDEFECDMESLDADRKSINVNMVLSDRGFEAMQEMAEGRGRNTLH